MTISSQLTEALGSAKWRRERAERRKAEHKAQEALYDRMKPAKVSAIKPGVKLALVRRQIYANPGYVPKERMTVRTVLKIEERSIRFKEMKSNIGGVKIHTPLRFSEQNGIMTGISGEKVRYDVEGIVP